MKLVRQRRSQVLASKLHKNPYKWFFFFSTIDWPLKRYSTLIFHLISLIFSWKKKKNMGGSALVKYLDFTFSVLLKYQERFFWFPFHDQQSFCVCVCERSFAASVPFNWNELLKCIATVHWTILQWVWYHLNYICLNYLLLDEPIVIWINLWPSQSIDCANVIAYELIVR